MKSSNIPILVDKLICSEQISCADFFGKKNRIYTFLNPVSYLEAKKNEDLFSKFDGIFSDGLKLVNFIKCFYKKELSRRSFDMTSLAPKLFEYAVENSKTIYIVASEQSDVEISVAIFKDMYPGLKIIGARNGFFENEKEIEHEVNKIISCSPDFLIVGMGIVRQEKFLLKTRNLGFTGVGFTCGGFIHQMAKNRGNYYPRWIDKHNLRFLYRMVKESHTRKRYLRAAVLFPLKFIKERYFD